MKLEDLKLTPKRKEICERLELSDSSAILSYYPYRYEEFSPVRYNDFRIGAQVCFQGELVSYPSTFRKGRLATTRFKVLYEDEILQITIFNRPWIRNLETNQQITIIGRYDGNNKVTASNYYTNDVLGTIIPSYPTKEGISQNEIKKLIEYTMNRCDHELEDEMPENLKNSHGLIDYRTAIHNIHKPVNKELLSKAMSRLKYEEFLRFYLALSILKGNTTEKSKEAKQFDEKKVNDFISSLGFELTADQKTAVEDILKDLKAEKIMYRLVQGEVGSGKTAVSMIGLYANYLSGYQGALMAPTEILAKQHYASLKKQFEPFGVKVGLLYSGIENDKEIKKALADGQIDVIVGTHALFSEDVIYHDLGLIIADEQHRFGVRQRQALKNKGHHADFIMMSATPIPRTLASSIYGDMDISTIATMPADRKGCKTYLIRHNSIAGILDQVIAKLQEGRQIYIIAAAISRNENYNAKDVEGLYEALKDVLEPYKTALIHGRLSTEQKDAIMADFQNNKIQVLVSTTVVEVGVNVKNATMMIIYDADKFGLSQLHQLRGRVQRSAYEGTCYLLTDMQDEEVIKRLEILCHTNDGFEIAYEDLKMRGPGDILGTRQSGLPAFILGNLIEDTRFIDAARKDAHQIAENHEREDYDRYYQNVAKLTAKNYLG